MPTRARPRRDYQGSSQFFNTAPGRALFEVAGMGGGPKPGGGGFLDSMRPSLRNALSNAYGESMLTDFDRMKPTVFERPGSDDPALAASAFGAPRTEVHNPRVDAPIAASEEARRQAFLDAMQDEELESSLWGPRAYREERENDYRAQQAASRYFDPTITAQRQEETARQIGLYRESPAVRSAQEAARGRLDVANIDAETRRAVAMMRNATTIDDVISAYGDLSRSGGFGIDRSGRPQGPPPELQQEATAALRRMLQGVGGGGMPGAAPGGAPGMMGGRGMGPGPGPAGGGQFTPQQQAALQVALDAGWREDEIDQIIAFLQATGKWPQ